MIHNSLEWSAKEAALLAKAAKLAHGHEVKKMILNINNDINELSRAEVLVRQGKKHSADELILKINNEIEVVEEFLFVAAILG